MTPQARRRFIPIIVLFLAGSILSVLIFGPKRPQEPKNQPIPESTTQEVTPEKESEPIPEQSPEVAVTEQAEIANKDLKPFEVLRLITHDETSSPVILGSLLDFKNWNMEVEFTKEGAGISSIRFSDI